ncbi:hypothetical protein K440DRAFT_638112 [Wilcoxina mikolae CBS 423.85]|nr:hypothetical protein K440DRAFT_638112 [Wilcoxina mikolae CBS 423.85]
MSTGRSNMQSVNTHIDKIFMDGVKFFRAQPNEDTKVLAQQHMARAFPIMMQSILRDTGHSSDNLKQLNPPPDELIEEMTAFFIVVKESPEKSAEQLVKEQCPSLSQKVTSQWEGVWGYLGKAK